jgi:hypothetical protein
MSAAANITSGRVGMNSRQNSRRASSGETVIRPEKCGPVELVADEEGASSGGLARRRGCLRSVAQGDGQRNTRGYLREERSI